MQRWGAMRRRTRQTKQEAREAAVRAFLALYLLYPQVPGLWDGLRMLHDPASCASRRLLLTLSHFYHCQALEEGPFGVSAFAGWLVDGVLWPPPRS